MPPEGAGERGTWRRLPAVAPFHESTSLGGGLLIGADMRVKATYEATICTECYYEANGVDYADGDPRVNEDGVKFASLLPEFADVSTVVDDEGLGEVTYWDEPFFSWHACEGCGSRLGGDRYRVRVTEWDYS